jgi:hypothetical protein
MATDQQLDIRIHGAQQTQSPTHGGLQPPHGGKGGAGIGPIHGLNGNQGASVTKYRYIRLRTTMTPQGAAVAFDEFVVAESAAGPNKLTGVATMSATETFAGTSAANLIDGVGGTIWSSNGSATWPIDVIADLGSNSANWVNPYEFRITARNGGNETQAPGDFTIGVSADNVSYTTKFTGSGQVFTAGQTKTFLAS